jgi:hypothetical protein
MLKLCVARTSTPIRINKRAAAAGLALCLAAVAALPQCAMAQMRQAGHEASRHFTQDQAKIIRRTLASRSLTQPQTLYVVELECSDCLDYSSELIDIVAKVPGWEINKAMLIGYSDEPESDIGLTLADAYPDDPAPATLALRDALTAARVPFSIAAATKPLEAKERAGTKIVISRVKRF